MEVFLELASFTSKTIVILIAVLIAVGFTFFITTRVRGRPPLEIEKLNQRFRGYRRAMLSQLLPRRDFRALVRDEKRNDREAALDVAAQDDSENRKTRIFVLDFNGDIRASAVESLREEITTILTVAKDGDEVVVRLESGGGLVNSYGLAASQLMRLRERGLKLTICVDKIAASGGYMMACVANRLIAAPFAVVGSIGVVAQVPNFHRLLEKHHVDYREVTAGEFKRTVSVLGEITTAGLEKFKSQIEDTHGLFKDFVLKNRPNVDIAQIATGEHWYGTQALTLNLVDEVTTSDDYLFKRHDDHDIYRVRYHGRRKLTERLSESIASALHQAVRKIWTDLDRTRLEM
jgi:serine protease SohB